MSRRPLMHPVGRLAKAQSRMAPGGMLWSESPIPRKYSPRVAMLGDDEAPPVPVLPQFWWKFDEPSPPFHETVTDAGNMTGGGGGNPPLAPGSVNSAGMAGSIKTADLAIPAITPGPSGRIVFDWWVKDLDITLTGAAVRARVTEFYSAESYDGVNPPWRLRVYFTATEPDVMVKRLRFLIGGDITSTPDGVLALTGWDNPAHFQWKLRPAAGGWEVFMGGTLAGSGTVAPFTWGGAWDAEFLHVAGSAYVDEFKVYGE